MQDGRRELRPGIVAALLCGLLTVLPACDGDGDRSAATRPGSPWVVLGVDGAEWSVLEELWQEGGLPNLRRLAERGATRPLETRYGQSPVIWTTIATGRRPREHGITGFVIPGEGGDVPVNSTLRRVPALWNMLSAAGRSVAAFGWWGTWPAEPIAGPMTSDRVLDEADRRTHPPALLERVEELRAEPAGWARIFDLEGRVGQRDAVSAQLGVSAAESGQHDLVLLYLRGVDVMSHLHWRALRPADFPPPGAGEGDLERRRRLVVREYEALDAVVGRLAELLTGTNVMVLSDHGFVSAGEEEIRVFLDLDGLFRRLGLQEGADDAVDHERSLVYGFDSPDFAALKKVRIPLRGRETGGRFERSDRARILAELQRALARVSWADGSPALRVREASVREAREGADLMVVLENPRSAGPDLLLDGSPAPLAGIVERVSRVSGTHGETTRGIFLAAGPDVDEAAEIDRITIHDIAPTVLYGLGLPVGEDFSGRAVTELFTAAFRRRVPLRAIPTWGERRAGESLGSEGLEGTVDEEIRRELEALGYL